MGLSQCLIFLEHVSNNGVGQTDRCRVEPGAGSVDCLLVEAMFLLGGAYGRGLVLGRGGTMSEESD